MLLKQHEEWSLKRRCLFSKLLMANLDSGHDLGQDQPKVSLTVAA